MEMLTGKKKSLRVSNKNIQRIKIVKILQSCLSINLCIVTSFVKLICCTFKASKRDYVYL